MMYNILCGYWLFVHYFFGLTCTLCISHLKLSPPILLTKKKKSLGMRIWIPDCLFLDWNYSQHVCLQNFSKESCRSSTVRFLPFPLLFRFPWEYVALDILNLDFDLKHLHSIVTIFIGSSSSTWYPILSLGFQFLQNNSYLFYYKTLFYYFKF